MMDNIYQCEDCHQVFRLPKPESGKVAACPGCSSRQVRELPAWVPLNTTLGESNRQWEYRCQDCQHTFKRPVPASPAEEQTITCPACGGHRIQRLTKMGGEPVYCGC